ncbi:MAG: hypothetical protein NVS3B10_09630 [Polyangiales bacterium]
MEWPDWWGWELELTPHLERRMEDRDFNEVELRAMLERAQSFRDDPSVEGRFIVTTTHRSRPWEVVVEPDREVLALVVVTAYGMEARS